METLNNSTPTATALKDAIIKVFDTYTEYFEAIAKGDTPKVKISDKDYALAMKFVEKMPKLVAFERMDWKALSQSVTETPTTADNAEPITPIDATNMENPVESTIREVKKNGLNGASIK